MSSIFPFFVSFDSFKIFVDSLSSNILITDDCYVISYFIFSFANVYFIISILKLCIKLFKKIIRVLCR